MRSVCHRIAGIAFRTEHDIQIPRLHESPFTQFEVPLNTPHDILLRFLDFSQKDGFEGESHPASLPTDVSETLCTTLIESFARQLRTRHFLQTGQEQLLVRDYESSSLTLIARAKVGGYPAGVHLAANLRLHFATFLPHFDAMAIHSGGIIRHSLALLFVAANEGGKTTAVRLSQKCPILHDDQVIVRRVEGQVNAYATPFGRLTDGPNSARLGGIFVLEQSSSFSISPVQKHDMLQCLWNGHPSILWGLPREEKIQAFDLLRAACSQAPAFHMRFPKDFIDWDAVDRAMNAG